MDPMTRQDGLELEKRLDKKIDDLGRDLKVWMLERETASIRWFVGTQVAYFVITLGAMYFIAGHVK